MQCAALADAVRRVGGCSRMRWRMQPHALADAAACVGGRGGMHRVEKQTKVRGRKVLCRIYFREWHKSRTFAPLSQLRDTADRTEGSSR